MMDPVQNVTWYEAVEFCNKLSVKEGKTPFYTISGATVTVDNWSADGYRLPTEMEWMWAAIGADQTADDMESEVNTVGHTKPYAGFVNNSSIIQQYVWFNANSGSPAKTHPVGLKSGNQLGLFDMSGNVWEWCWDGYKEPLDAGTLTDYYGDETPTNSSRSTKGGAFTTSDVNLLKHANRNSRSAAATANDLGFRVAQSDGSRVPSQGNLTVSFVANPDKTLTFAGPGSLMRGSGSSIEMSPVDTDIANTGTAWKWYLDGVEIDFGTPTEFSFNESSATFKWQLSDTTEPGVYRISASVLYKGIRHSGSFNLLVTY